MKYAFLFVLTMVSSQILFGQDGFENDIEIVMTKRKDYAEPSYTPSLGAPELGSPWFKAYPELKNAPKALDSVSIMSTYIDYGQVIYQAYRRGDMPIQFLNHIIQKWGIDTLQCSPRTISAYIRGIIGKKSGSWYYMLDDDGDGDLKNERLVKLSNGLSAGKEHSIIFHRYEEGRIVLDTTIIKVISGGKINGKVNSLNFRYLESRAGNFSYHGKEYEVLLTADFNSFRYDEGTKIKIIDKHSGVELGPYGQNDFVILNGDSLYIQQVKKDGSFIRLTSKKRQGHSLQKGFMAPDFSGTTLSQDTITLKSFKGTYTLVYFWNSSCGASTSRMEKEIIPLLSKVNTSETKLKVLGVALDFPQFVESFIKAKKISWPQVVTSANGPIRELYKIVHYPTIFLISPQGKILENSLELKGDPSESLEARVTSHLR